MTHTQNQSSPWTHLIFFSRCDEGLAPQMSASHADWHSTINILLISFIAPPVRQRRSTVTFTSKSSFSSKKKGLKPHCEPIIHHFLPSSAVHKLLYLISKNVWPEFEISIVQLTCTPLDQLQPGNRAESRPHDTMSAASRATSQSHHVPTPLVHIPAGMLHGSQSQGYAASPPPLFLWDVNANHCDDTMNNLPGMVV